MNITTLKNVTAAEYMKLKNLKGIHVSMIITAILSVIFGMIAYKFVNWQQGVMTDAGLGEYTGGTKLDLSTGTYVLLGVLFTIVAIASITAHEYKTNAHFITQTYVPQRWYEFIAKFIVSYTYSIAWCLIILVIGFITAIIFGPESMRNDASLLSNAGEIIGRFFILLLFYTLIVQGISYFTKNSSLSSTIVIIYLFTAENIVSMIPKYGDKIKPYLPKSSLDNLMMLGDKYPDVSVYLSAFIIIGFTLLVFIGGMLYNKNSDA